MDKTFSHDDRIARANWIQEQLFKIYPQIDIPLHHQSPFTLLVAVILSAQCTDTRVNQVTPKLFALADTPEKMRTLPIEIIEKIIYPCGFFRTKAKNIQSCADMIVNQFNGQVPETFEQLEQLPGVGHKTASVVMSHCFHQYAFPVDTHIRRLANRWGLSDSQNVRQIENDLKALYPKELWEGLHIRIIHYGRDYCPTRRHKIETCPICQKLHLLVNQ